MKIGVLGIEAQCRYNSAGQEQKSKVDCAVAGFVQSKANLSPAKQRRNARAVAAQDGFYLQQLDVFRFVAFLMVFVCHTFPRTAESYTGLVPPMVADALAMTIASGGFGVDLFFTLSAFLITELLIRELRVTGGLDIRSFYIRRALRIWPLYFAFIGAGFWLQFVLPIGPLPTTYLAALLLFVGNWTLAFGGHPGAAFVIFWSLCVEEQFYLLWPAALKLMSSVSLRTFAAAMLVISIVSRILFGLMDASFHSFWCATVTRLDPIAIGLLISSGWRPLIWNAPTTIFVGFFGIAAAQGIGVSLGDQWGPSVSYPVAAICCGLILSGALLIKVNAPKLAYLGKISFGLYVFHQAVIAVIVAFWIVTSPSLQLLRIGVCFLVTLFLAVISYELYEKPFLKIKSKFAHIKSRPI